MKVKDGMSQVVLSVGPAHTLRQAARMMSSQRVGAAVVLDHDRSGIGILTERDVLNSLGANQDPDSELVADHRTTDVVFASPDWTLEQAAQTMVSGGFRHLVVVHDGEVAGLLSMRDIVRCWSAERSSQQHAAVG
ncbi:MAG TPA: CBS domain-containing protein [Streptosporangiaceae bacterium]|nr:CBS domain-containing protein [Streptosporangiaceae bacterium]